MKILAGLILGVLADFTGLASSAASPTDRVCLTFEDVMHYPEGEITGSSLELDTVIQPAVAILSTWFGDPDQPWTIRFRGSASAGELDLRGSPPCEMGKPCPVFVLRGTFSKDSLQAEVRGPRPFKTQYLSLAKRP
jgi:hypothetical protein